MVCFITIAEYRRVKRANAQRRFAEPRSSTPSTCVCKGMGYKQKLCGDVHVWLSSWLYCRGRATVGSTLKEVSVIRNREVSRLREVADTWEPRGK